MVCIHGSLSRTSMDFLRNIPRVSDQMQALVDHFALTRGDIAVRKQIREELEQNLREVFSGCDLTLYGSSVNTFGCHGCDIDSFLDFHFPSRSSAPNKPPPRAEMLMRTSKTKLKQLVIAIITHREPPLQCLDLFWLDDHQVVHLVGCVLEAFGWKPVICIPTARTPIIKTQHPPTKINLDISYTGGGLVLRNTSLLAHYSNLDSRVRCLVFTVRRWMADRDLTGQTGFTNYCTSMLVMLYLSQCEPGAFPPPCKLHTESALNDPTPTGSLRRGNGNMEAPIVRASLNSPNSEALLLGFFEFYSEIEFSQTVLLIGTATVVDADKFKAPDGFKFSYVNIQDPFDLDHNIAKAVDFFTYLSFHEELRKAAVLLRRPDASLTNLLSFTPDKQGAPAVRRKLIRNSGPHSPATWNFYCLSRMKCDEGSEEDHFAHKVTLCKLIFSQFLRCEVVERNLSHDWDDLARLPPSFSVLVVLDCKLNFPTWIRRGEAKAVVMNDSRIKGIAGSKYSWILECLIADHICEKVPSRSSLSFSVVLINHFVDWYTVFMGVFFESVSPETRTLAAYLEKSLPRFFCADLFARFTKEDIDATETLLQAVRSGEVIQPTAPSLAPNFEGSATPKPSRTAARLLARKDAAVAASRRNPTSVPPRPVPATSGVGLQDKPTSRTCNPIQPPPRRSGPTTGTRVFNSTTVCPPAVPETYVNLPQTAERISSGPTVNPPVAVPREFGNQTVFTNSKMKRIRTKRKVPASNSSGSQGASAPCSAPPSNLETSLTGSQPSSDKENIVRKNFNGPAAGAGSAIGSAQSSRPAVTMANADAKKNQKAHRKQEREDSSKIKFGQFIVAPALCLEDVGLALTTHHVQQALARVLSDFFCCEQLPPSGTRLDKHLFPGGRMLDGFGPNAISSVWILRWSTWNDRETVPRLLAQPADSSLRWYKRESEIGYYLKLTPAKRLNAPIRLVALVDEGLEQKGIVSIFFRAADKDPRAVKVLENLAPRITGDIVKFFKEGT